MSLIKIMPCLDMKDGRVVKGVRFNELRDAGDPVENAHFYEKEGADELAILDISATIEGRKTRKKWVKDILSVITIPLTVGGGISTLSDMEELFELGVAKIGVNTAAVKRPNLIAEASKRYGSDRIIVAIDARQNKVMSSGFEVVIMAGTTGTGNDAIKWAKKCEYLGAGELLVTSFDRDGTKDGYDLDLTKAISKTVSVPVIASGGVGKLEHLYEGVIKGGATTLLAASIFHFRQISIKEIKEYLKEKGLKVRL
ncbi:imidazole glycerol phosphate synthase subunit HisF [Thermoproteota archaeon]